MDADHARRLHAAPDSRCRRSAGGSATVNSLLRLVWPDRTAMSARRSAERVGGGPQRRFVRLAVHRRRLHGHHERGRPRDRRSDRPRECDGTRPHPDREGRGDLRHAPLKHRTTQPYGVPRRRSSVPALRRGSRRGVVTTGRPTSTVTSGPGTTGRSSCRTPATRANAATTARRRSTRSKRR